MKLTRWALGGLLVLANSLSSVAAAQDQQGLLELRNTVVNLLEALVARGVLTREEAQSMVAEAQERAEAEIAALAAAEAGEEGAVRVTYVPEIVKDEIQAAVTADVQDDVVDEVMTRARTEGWGIPGALPEWTRRLEFETNLRVRGQGDYFDEQNAANTYLDFQAVNEAGGIGLAGPDALMNTTEDRARLRARLELDLAAHVTPSLTAKVAIATGDLDDPISMNETLANYGRRLEIGVQTAALEWNLDNSRATRSLDLYAGRFDNPYLSATNLWDVDLAFEGIAGKLAFDVFRRGEGDVEHGIFMTLGAFPLQEDELTGDDKWLYAGQVGMEIPLSRLAAFRFGAAYYQFKNIVGLQNAPDSRLNDITAPPLLARGNTLFDIRNDLDPNTNLFALASDYEIANLTLQLDFAAFGENRVQFTADYLENRGFDEEAVQARTGYFVEPRVRGRLVNLSVGRDEIRERGDWSVFAEYRYLERDAVLDVFTDSDFGLGGTDTEGFILGFDIGVASDTWFRTKWLSSNEIDGPPLGIDLLQVDINARF
jgi:hypothetical protein